MGAAAVTGRALSRRDLITVCAPAALAGVVGSVAGSLGSRSARYAWASPSADRTRAMALLREVIHRHARDPGDAYAVVHGVRAMGPEWVLGNGTPAVDHVLTTVVRRRAVGVRQYLYVPLDIEMHPNSFLETFLDAGVRWQQRVRADGQSYSFQNLFDHARGLFSFSNMPTSAGTRSGMHQPEADWFAWSLIAFPFGVPPEKDGWRNAFGEEIRVAEIAARGFQMMEEATAPLAEAMARGTLLLEKIAVHDLTSGGAHLLSGLISVVRRGYTQGGARPRLARQLDILVYRLASELQLIDNFYRPRRADPGAPLYELDTRLYFLGHALGNLALAGRAGLFRPTPAQQKALREAEAALYQTVEGLQGRDLATIRAGDAMLFDRFVADACYAYQALRLL